VLQAKSQPAAVQVGAPFGTGLQEAPHIVQFCGSSLRRMQRPAQGEYVASQVMVQDPSAHTPVPCAGVGHATPQAPQLAASESVSAHWPLQAVVPPGQVVPHAPAVQTSFSAQGASQPPQCAALTRVSTQDAPHFAKPSRQLKVQLPPAQEAVPFYGNTQA
jgi:hypothetical protein